MKSKRGGWKNEKHREQWSTTLAGYVYPIIGHLQVGAIETSHVLEVLQQPVTLAKGHGHTPVFHRPSRTRRLISSGTW